MRGGPSRSLTLQGESTRATRRRADATAVRTRSSRWGPAAPSSAVVADRFDWTLRHRLLRRRDLVGIRRLVVDDVVVAGAALLEALGGEVGAERAEDARPVDVPGPRDVVFP